MPFDPLVPLPGIYPADIVAHVLIELCAKLFIAALFVTARQHTDLLGREWTRRVIYDSGKG